MNAIFNIERYLKLEKRNLFFSKMHYIYILGGLTGLYLLSMLMKIFADTSFSALIYLVVFVIIVAGPCFFEKTRSKQTSIFDFILPASTFEKFLSFWMKYVIIIPLSVILLFLILNTATGLIPLDAIKEHADSMSLNHIQGGKIAFFIIFGTQAIFMVGYFYFRKHAFAKTSVLLLLISIIILIVSIFIGIYFFKGQSAAFSIGSEASQNSLDLSHNIASKIIAFGQHSFIKILGLSIKIIFLGGMWVVCFFKLRETEI